MINLAFLNVASAFNRISGENGILLIPDKFGAISGFFIRGRYVNGTCHFG